MARAAGGGAGQGASGRSAATGGESIVQISGLNQVKVGIRSVRRIWLPTATQILNLSSQAANIATTTVALKNLPPFTVSLLLNAQIRVNSGTNPEVSFYVHNSTANSSFTQAVAGFSHGNGTNAGAGQLIVPLTNSQLIYEVAIAGTVNYNLTVNLVAVEVM